MKKSNQPLISIITVVYNGAQVIENTVLSVIHQSMADYEYIVIDGGSKDETLSILEKYKNDISVLMSEPDKGIYDAMNKGIARASGEWINFMNAGDSFFTNTTLQEISAFMNSSAGVVYGNYIRSVQDELQTRHLFGEAKNSENSLFSLPTCHQAFFTRTALLKDNLFDISYSWCADYEQYTRLAAAKTVFIRVPLTICHFDGSGGKNRKITAYIRERYRASRRLVTGYKRNVYFLGEYVQLCIVHPIVVGLKKILPLNWLMVIRKARGLHV